MLRRDGGDGLRAVHERTYRGTSAWRQVRGGSAGSAMRSPQPWPLQPNIDVLLIPPQIDQADQHRARSPRAIPAVPWKVVHHRWESRRHSMMAAPILSLNRHCVRQRRPRRGLTRKPLIQRITASHTSPGRKHWIAPDNDSGGRPVMERPPCAGECPQPPCRLDTGEDAAAAGRLGSPARARSEMHGQAKLGARMQNEVP